MAVFAYIQEEYRPIEFTTPKNVGDGLDIEVFVYKDGVGYDVTWEESVQIDISYDTTVAICDFTKPEDPSLTPGVYSIVVQTKSPVTVLSKDTLILWNRTGFSLEKIEWSE